jgi:hypothetical protein
MSMLLSLPGRTDLRALLKPMEMIKPTDQNNKIKKEKGRCPYSDFCYPESLYL